MSSLVFFRWIAIPGPQSNVIDSMSWLDIGLRNFLVNFSMVCIQLMKILKMRFWKQSALI